MCVVVPCTATVTVSVWDISSLSSPTASVNLLPPTASRQLVLTCATVGTDVANGFVALQWESDRRFFAVGPAGAYEFEFQDANLVAASSLRYRPLLKPEEVVNTVRQSVRQALQQG